MKHPNLYEIAKQLNLKARQHPIGMLPRVRMNLKGLSRRPPNDIFSSQKKHDNYVYHYGGQPELQFNIGLEDGEFRHGVAFSFKRTINVKSPIEVLRRGVGRFNRFMRTHPNLYRDMRIWHNGTWESHGDKPGPLPQELVREDEFVFLGKLTSSDRIDYEAVLADFDRLLPLYVFVEGGRKSSKSRHVAVPSAEFVFCPGFSTKASSTTAKHSRKQHEVDLIQNKLQPALCRRLVSQYGKENVGDEQQSGVGTKVDVVVRRKKGYWFYEIKTANSPKICLRQAIGQLLEYAFWTPTIKVTRMIVVGQNAIDKDGRDYLRRLNERFSLPIEYEQIAV
jgi:hypothetical protein